ncbi:DUF2306 domain-containing protein [Sagittula sp. S175]|uniref:DUF2306 domain-containing protein n=1 Tax=Sagittula sp. S175 TaxID=3415129 RepID=UPI003C7E3BE2
MQIQPFLDAGLVVQVHAVAATWALVTGPFVLWRQRRDRLHKVGGYLWVLAMALAAGSSFWINGFAMIGPFSPIHLLAVLALGSLWFGMRAILRGDVRAHQRAFRNLYLRGVLVAGLFNFLPGRVVNRMFLGEAPEQGYTVIAVGCAVLAVQLAVQVLRGRGRSFSGALRAA